ncbi:MAG: hypothetical protein DMF64_04400 [Acidobacteria bacterium]|nr:MAG: hypothetical protein DMF64_04400 [Acidobacteriota bacterium]
MFEPPAAASQVTSHTEAQAEARPVRRPINWRPIMLVVIVACAVFVTYLGGGRLFARTSGKLTPVYCRTVRPAQLSSRSSLSNRWAHHQTV